MAALATDETTIMVGGETIILRPSLRAAMRLERRYGFPGLLKAIVGGSLSAISHVIAEAGVGASPLRPTSTSAAAGAAALPSHAAPAIFSHLLQDGLPLRHIETIIPPLADFVLALAGYEDTETPQTDTGGKRIPFAEYHERLFRIATGWLGWPPEVAWNATPAEILAAHRGRGDMLRSIFGGADDEPDTKEGDQALSGFLRGLATRKASNAHRKRTGPIKPKTARAA